MTKLVNSRDCRRECCGLPWLGRWGWCEGGSYPCSVSLCGDASTMLVLSFHSKYQLVFCYTIIERNNRQMLPVIRNTAGGDSVQTCTNPLDTFFPFDPCVLKRWVHLDGTHNASFCWCSFCPVCRPGIWTSFSLPAVSLACQDEWALDVLSRIGIWGFFVLRGHSYSCVSLGLEATEHQDLLGFLKIIFFCLERMPLGYSSWCSGLTLYLRIIPDGLRGTI